MEKIFSKFEQQFSQWFSQMLNPFNKKNASRVRNLELGRL